MQILSSPQENATPRMVNFPADRKNRHAKPQAAGTPSPQSPLAYCRRKRRKAKHRRASTQLLGLTFVVTVMPLPEDRCMRVPPPEVNSSPAVVFTPFDLSLIHARQATLSIIKCVS